MTCRNCGEEKPFELFRVDSRMRSGRARTCKVCVSEATQRWKAEHAGDVKETNERRRLRRKIDRNTVPAGWVRGCSECGEHPTNWYSPKNVPRCPHGGRVIAG